IISGWDKIGLNLYQSFLSVKNVTKYRLSAEENVSCKQNYGRKECSIFITPLCEWPDKITLYPLIRKSDSLSTSFNIGLSFNISLSSSDSEICDNGIDDDCNGQTDGVDLKCAMFAISVLPGEGLTSLARRAVIQYLEKFYDNSYLNKEQKIYAEDYIKKDLKNEIGTLKSGEKVEFSSSLIEEAIAKSKRLSSDEIDSIGEYKELINYSGYKIISKSESVADVDMVWRIDNDIKEQLEKVRRFKDDTSEAWKVVDSEGSLVVYYQNENIDNVFYLIGAYRENIAVQDYNIAEDLLIHSVELSDNGINWGKGEIFYNNFYNKNVSASGLDGKGAGNFYVDVKDYNKGSLYIRFNLKSYTSGTGITLTKNLKVNLSDADLSEKEKAVIIYPDRSSVLETGETYQIQWKPNDPNRLIDIILNNNTTAYSEDALVWHLRESVPDTGNYFFTVPKNLKIGNKYQFIITQYYHHKIGINTLVSDEFSIMSE
ncbi:hypothetical protein KAS41_03295, partial [Candidatus Parcubacteria bacterium]|nr:hypothetical protein [Candidatus Parcubacteria bacterium]